MYPFLGVLESFMPYDKDASLNRVPPYLQPNYLSEFARHLIPVRNRKGFGLDDLKQPAGGYAIYNPSTNEIIFEKYFEGANEGQGADHRIGYASTIKIATVALALRHMPDLVPDYARKKCKGDVQKAKDAIDRLIQLSLIQSDNDAAKELGELIGGHIVNVHKEAGNFTPTETYVRYVNYVLREESGVHNTVVVNANGLPHASGYAGIIILDEHGQQKWNMQQTTPHDMLRIMTWAANEIERYKPEAVSQSMSVNGVKGIKPEKNREFMKLFTSREGQGVALAGVDSDVARMGYGNATVRNVFFKTGSLNHPRFYNGAWAQEYTLNDGEKLIAVGFLGGFKGFVQREQATLRMLEEAKAKVQEIFPAIIEERVGKILANVPLTIRNVAFADCTGVKRSLINFLPQFSASPPSAKR